MVTDLTEVVCLFREYSQLVGDAVIERITVFTISVLLAFWQVIPFYRQRCVCVSSTLDFSKTAKKEDVLPVDC